MSVMSQKVFRPEPPMKGSFPLDHENTCRPQMIIYMKCLQDNHYVNENCREKIKNYLECRMENGLMAKEPWEALGLKEFVEEDKTAGTDST